MCAVSAGSAMTVSHRGAMAVVNSTNFHFSYSLGGVSGDKVRQLLLLWHLSSAALLPGQVHLFPET